MAMIMCTECGKMISNMAKACPNCGMPIQEVKNVKKKNVEYCPECGRKLESGARFCLGCGAKVNSDKGDNQENKEEKLNVVYCPKCGGELEAGARFCKACGKKVDNNDSENQENVSVSNNYTEQALSCRQESTISYDAQVYEEKAVANINTGNQGGVVFNGAGVSKGNFITNPPIKNLWFWLLVTVVPIVSGILFIANVDILPTIIISFVLNSIFLILDDLYLKERSRSVNVIGVGFALILFFPIYVIIRAIKTKTYPHLIVYIVLLTINILLAFGIISFSASGDFLKYVNVQMKEVNEQESRLLDYYEEYVEGQPLFSTDVFSTISDILIPGYKALKEKAIDIYRDISNEDIKELHSIYIDYCDAWVNLLTYYKKYIESSDETFYLKAENAYNLINQYAKEYQKREKDLANQFGVTLY